MDPKALLEQLLDSGKKLAEKGMSKSSEVAAQGKELAGQGLEKGKQLAGQGLDFATENFGLPEAGPQRDKVLKGLGVGAAAGGLLALLVGTRKGRKVLSPAVKLGSLAALGGIGYKVYTDWQKSQGGNVAGHAISALTDQSANDRSLSIIKAMISAAKADSTIDANEQQAITEHIENSGLDQSVSSLLMTELQKPVDIAEVAASADSPETAVEIYLASLLVTDKQNEAEQSYLTNLAHALKLDAGLVENLENEAFSPA